MVFAKTYAYSFKEFRNLELIKELNKVENLLNHIRRNKSLYRKLTIIVCIMLISYMGKLLNK